MGRDASAPPSEKPSNGQNSFQNNYLNSLDQGVNPILLIAKIASSSSKGSIVINQVEGTAREVQSSSGVFHPGCVA